MSDHSIGIAATLLRDGEMKRLDVDGTAVLLVRRGAEYFAIGADCSHYGGPLEKGVLCGFTVMCPWHHACFDIRHGARLEPPALNDMTHYAVRIESGQVIVALPQDNVQEPKAKIDASDKRQFVIVGGGSAGNAAAEELRRSGYGGHIIIVSQEPNVPLDRPNLSKDYLAGTLDPALMPLRGNEQWYTERKIELKLGTRVVKVNTKTHTLHLDQGGDVHYDKLLLATGSTARQISDVPGADLEGIYTLRTIADADRIIQAAKAGKQAVIIGASFIGMEVAASLAKGQKLAVTVVGPGTVPFERILGADIGKMFRKEHEANGVQFQLGAEVKGFVGSKKHVTGVELKNGKTLPADFVVLGVGVAPATDFLQGSGLTLNDKDKAVRVNASLQSSDPDVYAAGDIARWEDGSETGQRIEHWRLAEQHGMIAARGMLGNHGSMTEHIPFFWTQQWDIELRYVGHAEKWTDIVYRYGKPAHKDFVAFYVGDGKLLAAAGLNHDADLDAVEFILQTGKPLTTAQMSDKSFDLVAYALLA